MTNRSQDGGSVTVKRRQPWGHVFISAAVASLASVVITMPGGLMAYFVGERDKVAGVAAASQQLREAVSELTGAIKELRREIADGNIKNAEQDQRLNGHDQRLGRTEQRLDQRR